MNRRQFLSASASVMLAVTGNAGAKNSSAPIKLLVGYPPGGSVDTAARLIAPRLRERLGQAVVIENRPGAGGTLAATATARATPDGHTLLLAAAPELTIAPLIQKGLPYDPLKELRPVAMYGNVPFLLVVPSESPFNSVEALVNAGRAASGRLSYGSFGGNTTNHLFGEKFKLSAKIQAIHVPYRGSGPALVDLMGKQIDYMFDTVTSALPQVNAGKLRALAVTTSERLSLVPSVPTLVELGFTELVGGSWFAFVAPYATPDANVDRLRGALNSILSDVDFRRELIARTILPTEQLSDSQLRSLVSKETQAWKKLIDQLGIKPE